MSRVNLVDLSGSERADKTGVVTDDDDNNNDDDDDHDCSCHVMSCHVMSCHVMCPLAMRTLCILSSTSLTLMMMTMSYHDCHGHVWLGATGERLMEGGMINKSLHTLSQVLCDRSSYHHRPTRALMMMMI